MHIDPAIEPQVKSILNQHLLSCYVYHNYQHAEYVRKKAREIARHENLGSKEMFLLDIAAMWHDVGYITGPRDHEAHGCQLVRKHLPRYGFNDIDIELICGMIMATKVPQEAHTLSEAILADADMSYLATEHAEELARKLYAERLSADPALTEKQWDKQQIEFIEAHHFLTDYGKTVLEPRKAIYVAQLKEKLRNKIY
jgi:uncharacterized protein